MITLEPKDFVWRVGQECHRWITADARLGSGKERFLTDAVPIGTAGYRTSLPLLDHSMLFREFAATPSNEAAIAAFADRNGMLGKGVVLPVGDGNGTGQLMGTGETFALWKKELAQMRRCIVLHEAARKADLEVLEHHIRWSEEQVSYHSHPDWRPGDPLPADLPVVSDVITWKKLNANQFNLLRAGDLVTPAFWYVQSEINTRISEEASPRLLWNVDTNKLVSRIIPKNLLGAMWLQFALAVERGSDFRQCAHCGKWFELSPGTSRSDKQFCSTACRVKAFRLRKLEHAGQAGAKDDSPTADSTVEPNTKRSKSKTVTKRPRREDRAE